MTSGMNLCWACKHLHEDSAELDGVPTGTCAAYPKGIPLAIFAGAFDHREPFRNDGGVRFEPLDEQWGADAVQMLATRTQP